MNSEREPWSPATRIAFRFGFVLFTLSALKMLAAFFPWGLPFRPYWFVWQTLLTKLTPLVFHFKPTGTLQGSDSLSAWTMQLWTLTISVVVALVWTARARATEYSRLFDAQRTLVRYSLSLTMLGYGLAKIFMLQFWAPTPTDLIQTFAGSSPFALIWRVTGHSATYQQFGGVLEVLGALLILWRRTTTLGAIVLVGVLSNVVMLNFCYQIPVKNFSCELLLQSAWLLIPQARRVLAVLLSRAVPPPAPVRPFALSGRREKARLVVKGAWLVGIVGLSLFGHVNAWRSHGSHAAKPDFWGAYDVESFTVAGASVSSSEAKGWRQVAFGATWGPAFAFVTGDGVYHLFDLEYDPAHASIKLQNFDGDGTDKPETLGVTRIDATHLEIDGTLDGDRVHARLRQHDLSKSTIYHRFSWVDDGGFWR